MMKNLNKLNRPQLISPARSRKKTFLIRFLVALALLFVLIYLPARGAYLASKQLMASGKQFIAAAKQENFDQMQMGLNQTAKAVNDLNGSLNWFIWLRLIPFVGGYYSDAKHFTSAASYEMEAVMVMMKSLEPYKNELGLTGQVTAGQDRIAQAVKILNKVLPESDKVEPFFREARSEVENIDTGKYPEKFRGKILRGNLEAAKNFIIGADIALLEHKDALSIVPEALGESSQKTYLLLFQNDKEIRATGGFITAFAFLKLDKGRLVTTTSDDIYRLDERLLKVCLNKICPLAPPAPIVKYLPEMTGKPRAAWSMRDSNISPDLPTSMKEFERMYNMLGDGEKFDGIILIDSQVVEELIAVTGPIDVFGTKYSAEIDKRCSCPNVIYELEHYAEVASKGEADRKAVLGALMQSLLAKILAAGPDMIPAFLDTGVKLANDKHVMFYLHDSQAQEALSKLEWTGEIKQFGGDYLHLNDSNFAGGKSNLYVEEKVTVDINIDKDGSVKNKVTIDYKNSQPFSTWLNGILRDYVRLYVPAGARLVNSRGSEPQDPVKANDDESLGKTFFEAFITVRPQNSRTLSFEYTLPNKVNGKSYKLLIQKQPGAKDHHYVIKINGNKKTEFDLTSDKELNLSF